MRCRSCPSSRDTSDAVLDGSRARQAPKEFALRLLLVEDDTMIGKAVRQGLDRAGFSVDRVLDGRDAELAMGSGVYHAVVLDLCLPSKDGLELLKAARAKDNNVPVLIITA